MNPEQVAALIRAALPDALVQVRSEDNTHYAALVVSASFAGQRSIRRHQAIYQALGERMGREIHAMSIEALTPEESNTVGTG
jgi:acid stress-induced BolA-like protein IbaG/YrbA